MGLDWLWMGLDWHPEALDGLGLALDGLGLALDGLGLALDGLGLAPSGLQRSDWVWLGCWISQQVRVHTGVAQHFRQFYFILVMFYFGYE